MKVGSSIKILDNSKVKEIFIIINLSRKTLNITLGDIVLGIVKKVSSGSKFKLSSIVKALIVQTKLINTIKSEDISLKFFNNGGVIISKDGNPSGTKCAGIFSIPITLHKFLKVISLSKYKI